MRFTVSIVTASCLVIIGHAVMAEELTAADEVPAALQVLGTSDYSLISANDAKKIRGESFYTDVLGEIGLPNAEIGTWTDSPTWGGGSGTSGATVDERQIEAFKALFPPGTFPEGTIFSVDGRQVGGTSGNSDVTVDESQIEAFKALFPPGTFPEGTTFSVDGRQVGGTSGTSGVTVDERQVEAFKAQFPPGTFPEGTTFSVDGRQVGSTHWDGSPAGGVREDITEFPFEW